MSAKRFLKTVLLVCAMFSGAAKATECSLSLNQMYWWNGNYVQQGHTWAYGITLSPGYYPNAGPYNPNFNGLWTLLVDVAFYGTGINPNGPGEVYPGPVMQGQTTWQTHWVTGFGNPGGISGTYTRYAVLRSAYGDEFCRTNSIDVTLQ